MAPGSYLALSNSSDPYQALEKDLRLTRQFLKLAADHPLKIMLVTKSDLITRDIDILKNLPQVVVSMTLTTLDHHLAKILEPGAPLPEQRLIAMERLSLYIPVACRIDPLIPGLNVSEIPVLIKELKKRGVKQIITSTYKAKGDNFIRMKKAFPDLAGKWDLLYKDQGEKRSGSFYLFEDLRRKMIVKVKQCAEQENLKFSSCRENFPDLNTAACDGSDLF